MDSKRSIFAGIGRIRLEGIAAAIVLLLTNRLLYGAWSAPGNKPLVSAVGELRELIVTILVLVLADVKCKAFLVRKG